jgi:hypothetical protein
MYTAVATDALERTLSALHEGQAAAGSTTAVTNAAGRTIANSTVAITDNGVLAAPSPPLHRYDVTVTVVPVNTADAADGVSLVASVVQ